MQLYIDENSFKLSTLARRVSCIAFHSDYQVNVDLHISTVIVRMLLGENGV